MTRIAAIIPVGTLEGAKTRLGESLDAEERQDLVDGLLTRTVEAVLATGGVADVLVVSPDREVLRRAADMGARTLRQASRGLNAGVREARSDVVAGGAEAVVVMPIDLPFVTPDLVMEVVDAVAGGGSAVGGSAAGSRRDGAPVGVGDRIVVLVTDRHGTGTNVLALRPPDVIDVAFGPGSRRAHQSAAETVGATYSEVENRLSIDLDTADDLVFVEAARVEGLGVG